jgi:hypothetical protein
MASELLWTATELATAVTTPTLSTWNAFAWTAFMLLTLTTHNASNVTERSTPPITFAPAPLMTKFSTKAATDASAMLTITSTPQMTKVAYYAI